MNDPQNIIKLQKELKGWSISGDVLLLVLICAAIFVIYHWQKNQIKTLKDYIKFWNPTQLKQDVNSYIELKDQINQATLEQLRAEISQAKDKESEAIRIITDLQERNKTISDKLANYEKPDLSDIIPKDAELSTSSDLHDVMWTLKFRNGVIKRFKIPVKPTKS